jgi:hypothetical protein
MQSKVPVEKINHMRDFVSDMIGDATLNSMWCSLQEDYIRYGMSCTTSDKDEFEYRSVTIVPKDVREDYALKFIEWTFDDTVLSVDLDVNYDEITLTVKFVGGETQSFSQEFYCEGDDDDDTIAIHAIKVRRR